MEYQIGDKVSWRCLVRGGYGYGYWVDGVVIDVKKRVKIEVQKTNGETAQLWVKPNRLVKAGE